MAVEQKELEEEILRGLKNNGEIRLRYSKVKYHLFLFGKKLFCIPVFLGRWLDKWDIVDIEFIDCTVIPEVVGNGNRLRRIK